MKLSYEVKVNIYVMRKPGVTWLQIYDQVDVKVTYSVKSYLPGYAEVYVRPEVVNLESVNFDSLISLSKKTTELFLVTTTCIKRLKNSLLNNFQVSFLILICLQIVL